MSAQVDAELMVDPLFKQMTAKFDELSLGNLMTSKLSINSDLLVQLDSSMPQAVFKSLEDLQLPLSQMEQRSEEEEQLLEAMRQDWTSAMPLLQETAAPSFCAHLDEYIMVQQSFIDSLLNRNINQSMQD